MCSLRLNLYGHSNETVWPWYSRIAPMSWLVVWDVFEGRKELNFSTWNRLTAEQRVKAIHECWKEIEEEDNNSVRSPHMTLSQVET